MMGAIGRPADARGPVYQVLRPGSNCWRIDRAEKFGCIQDAADHFRLVRQAILAARDTVFILGWDIYAGVDLLPGQAAADGPTRLDELLAFVARRRRHLRCYILIWDYATLYTFERDPFSRWKLGWRMPRNVRFSFDNRIPLGGSQHQKVVVVDDQIAFAGGIDLTGHRWDTCEHRVDEPARTSAGQPYSPYHEVQAMMTGPAAKALGLLARERWRVLGDEPMPPFGSTTRNLWPADVEPDLRSVDVAISRTVPASASRPAIRECEALFLDSIAAAQRSIYIESQYFTNEALGTALAGRLHEPHGPEVVVVSPKECDGWLEKSTMGTFRDRVFRRLIAADAHGRLRLVFPAASRSAGVPTFVHSKVMIVDDELVRIGSANFSRRSMGVDSECDVTVEAAGNPSARTGIRRIRARLLAEHLGIPVADVEHQLAHQPSLRRLVDAHDSRDHTLVPIDLACKSGEPPSEALRAAADPDEPLLSSHSIDEAITTLDVMPGSRSRRLSLLTFIVLTAAAAVVSASLFGLPAASFVVAAALMSWMLLRARRFARSVSQHRSRAEFG